MQKKTRAKTQTISFSTCVSRRKFTGPEWNLCPGLWSRDVEARALLPQNTQEWVTLYSLRALGALWLAAVPQNTSNSRQAFFSCFFLLLPLVKAHKIECPRGLLARPLKSVSTGHFWLLVRQWWWWQTNKSSHIDVHLSSNVSSIKTATQPTQAQGSEWTGHSWCAKGVLVRIIRCKETVGDAGL
jgi:hypothetical protein